jgi:spermidine/putrescine-binding protein
MRTLLLAGGRTALILLFAFAVQACNRILHVNEDPTGLSEIELAKQRALESNLGVHLSPSGFGQLIEGVALPREMVPQAIRVTLEQEKIGNHLLELYLQAAQQAPAVKQELFHEIEELELRSGDVRAFVWWLDREAIAYPDSAAAIRKKKMMLGAADGPDCWGRGLTIRLLIWNGYLNRAILDDFERENERINVRVYCYETHDQLLQLLQAEADLQRKLNAPSTPHAFDIAMPSDTGAAILAEKGWLAPIVENPAADDELGRNLKLIDADFRKLIARHSAAIKVDVNRYSIPYRWSATGIAYNLAFIDQIPFSWAALVDPMSLSSDALRIRYRKMSMLIGPELTFTTALLYLANRRIESPDMRTIDTAETLLRDSKIISDGLPHLVSSPVSRLLLDDLDKFITNLREPRGLPPEEFAGAFHNVQDELLWMLLKLDALEPSAMPPRQPFPSTKPGYGDLQHTPDSLVLGPHPDFGSDVVIDSMRQLTLITYEDLGLAVLFLKRIADLEARVNIILTRDSSSGSDGDAGANPGSPAYEGPGWSNESYPAQKSNPPNCVRAASAIQAALQTFKKALESGQPRRFNDIAANFSALERQANSLLDNSRHCSLEAKLEIAMDLLFRGPGISDPAGTEKMVSLLTGQDRSDAALKNPETQNKVDEALSYLQMQNSYVSYYLTDSETRAALASGKVLLAQATGADVAWAAQTNSMIRFSLPEEGVIGSIDSFVILSYGHSRNKANTDACRAFLSYLLRPENAARMVNFSKYASTEEAALTFVDAEIRNGATYMRPGDWMKVHLLTVLSDQARTIYSRDMTPLVPSNVLLQHPEFELTKSLFGVLFQVSRPTNLKEY